MEIIVFAVVVGLIAAIGFWSVAIVGGKKLVEIAAKTEEEFLKLPREQQLAVLQALQKRGQTTKARSYFNALGEGPVTDEIRSMAARENISLPF